MLFLYKGTTIYISLCSYLNFPRCGLVKREFWSSECRNKSFVAIINNIYIAESYINEFLSEKDDVLHILSICKDKTHRYLGILTTI